MTDIILKLYGWNVNVLNLDACLRKNILLAICVWSVIDIFLIWSLYSMSESILSIVLGVILVFLSYYFHASSICFYILKQNFMCGLFRFVGFSIALNLPLLFWYISNFIYCFGFKESITFDDILGCIFTYGSSIVIVTTQYFLIIKNSSFYIKFAYEYAR